MSRTLAVLSVLTAGGLLINFHTSPVSLTAFHKHTRQGVQTYGHSF